MHAFCEIPTTTPYCSRGPGWTPRSAPSLRRTRTSRHSLSRWLALIDMLLPRFVQESKKYATITIGCTGGRHRSVYLVEKLADHLADRIAAARASGDTGLGWRLQVTHRELAREGLEAAYLTDRPVPRTGKCLGIPRRGCDSRAGSGTGGLRRRHDRPNATFLQGSLFHTNDRYGPGDPRPSGRGIAIRHGARGRVRNGTSIPSASGPTTTSRTAAPRSRPVSAAAIPATGWCC